MMLEGQPYNQPGRVPVCIDACRTATFSSSGQILKGIPTASSCYPLLRTCAVNSGLLVACHARSCRALRKRLQAQKHEAQQRWRLKHTVAFVALAAAYC
jgi:hypothetical protein